jgi:hypothetical protein
MYNNPLWSGLVFDQIDEMINCLEKLQFLVVKAKHLLHSSAVFLIAKKALFEHFEKVNELWHLKVIRRILN